MAEHEVLVVGAGPAGVAAGISARRLGLDVLVVDRSTFPRDKTCGDGLTAGALRALERLGFDARTLPSYVRVEETVLVSPSGRRVSLPLPLDGHHAAVVPRTELDHALVGHARSLGVPVRDGTGLASARTVTDGIEVALDDGDVVTARWVIAADGHYSPTRRLLADPRGAHHAELGTWHAFRQYFRGVDDPRLWVLFDADLLPGYAWVFPVGGGRANVGFGVLRDGAGSVPERHAGSVPERRAGSVPERRTGHGPSGKHLAAQWRAVMASRAVRDALGPSAVPEAAHRAWPIPATFDPARLARGRALFAGDAANVVDPMTGEGIAQALLTGELASRAIAHDASAPAVAARYRSDVTRALGADLRFARLLQHVLRTSAGTRGAIAAAALTPWTRRNFARWMFEDYPRAAILTPQRWARPMFTRPGAYAGRPLHSA